MSIQIPLDFKGNPAADKKFKELVEFFNKLEKELEWPNCEGYADKNRILAKAQSELIMREML